MARPPTKTILIADDDEEIVDFLSRRCSHLGLRVVIAHTGFDALMEIRTRLPDVVCLDVNMPAGDGLSVCQMLVSDQESFRLPVIILTGLKDERTVRRCHELTAFYVKKGDNVWAHIEPFLNEVLKLPKSMPKLPCSAAVCEPSVLLEAHQLQPETD